MPTIFKALALNTVILWRQKCIYMYGNPFGAPSDSTAPWINANEKRQHKHAAFDPTETFLLFLALFQGQ